MVKNSETDQFKACSIAQNKWRKEQTENVILLFHVLQFCMLLRLG